MSSDGRYTERPDRPWYGRLEEMSHQEQDAINEEWQKQHPDGPLMEKYRAKHDFDFMQSHECGRGDCPDHGEKPLDWENC